MQPGKSSASRYRLSRKNGAAIERLSFQSTELFSCSIVDGRNHMPYAISAQCELRALQLV
jgi:hypothetical protein